MIWFSSYIYRELSDVNSHPYLPFKSSDKQRLWNQAIHEE